MDAASHRALEEFVREVTAPERDALVKLSLEVEQIEVRLGMRPKPKRDEREARARRRREVTRLADGGLSMTQIAKRLAVSRSTVRSDLEAVGAVPARPAAPQGGGRPRNVPRPREDHPWRPAGGVVSPA